MKTLVALYDNVAHARQTAEHLAEAGVARDDTHLIVHDAENQYEIILGEAAQERVVTAEEMRIWRQRIEQGGALLMVSVEDNQAAEVREIMERYGLIDMEALSTSAHEAGELSQAGQTSAGAGEPQSEAESWAMLETSFRRHHEANHEPSGFPYTMYEPAYHYGYQLASDRRYAERTWQEIEPAAQRDWEANRRGEWSQFRDAVRHAWNQMRGADEWREIDEEVESTKRGQQYRHLKEDRW